MTMYHLKFCFSLVQDAPRSLEIPEIIEVNLSGTFSSLELCRYVRNFLVMHALLHQYTTDDAVAGNSECGVKGHTWPGAHNIFASRFTIYIFL